MLMQTPMNAFWKKEEACSEEIFQNKTKIFQKIITVKNVNKFSVYIIEIIKG